tara:strand:+ start:26610 stop:27233 length:624 start_codon:yes stop_codon:yes gene_type:complete
VAKKPAAKTAAPKAASKSAAPKKAAPKKAESKKAAKPAAKPKAAPKKAAASPKAKPAPKAPAKKAPVAKANPKAAAIAARDKAEAAKLAAARKQVQAMLKLVTKCLDDDKVEDIVAIDLSGKTPMADYMVVASGRSTRHVASSADHLMRRLKENGYGLARVEGLPQGDWVLIDAGDIVIHIFRPEVREFYRLEKMWAADIPDDNLAV